jgi:hypothetical protein
MCIQINISQKLVIQWQLTMQILAPYIIGNTTKVIIVIETQLFACLLSYKINTLIMSKPTWNIEIKVVVAKWKGHSFKTYFIICSYALKSTWKLWALFSLALSKSDIMNKIRHQQLLQLQDYTNLKIEKRLLIEYRNFLIKTQSITQQFCVATFYCKKREKNTFVATNLNK